MSMSPAGRRGGHPLRGGRCRVAGDRDARTGAGPPRTALDHDAARPFRRRERRDRRTRLGRRSRGGRISRQTARAVRRSDVASRSSRLAWAARASLRSSRPTGSRTAWSQIRSPCRRTRRCGYACWATTCGCGLANAAKVRPGSDCAGAGGLRAAHLVATRDRSRRAPTDLEVARAPVPPGALRVS